MHICPECLKPCDCADFIDDDENCTHYRTPECTVVEDDEEAA